MKIAIIDDCTEDASHLKDLLQDFFTDRQLSLDCSIFPSGETFLFSAKQTNFDLVFLDIYMDGLNGIDTACQLRKQGKNELIVFLTTSPEHALASFAVHPFDYLLKPCSSQDVERVLTEVLQLIPHAGLSLELSVGRQKISILYRELFYLIADGHYVRAFGKHVTDIRCSVTSFSSIWDTLRTDKRFLLCNRGIILNMDQVEKLDEDCFLMKNNIRLPIRQSNRQEVIQTFVTYQYEKARKYGERFHQTWK